MGLIGKTPNKIKTKIETITTPTFKVPEQQIVTARNFYNMGIDVETAHRQPGMPGRKTCQKLWRFWEYELLQDYNMDTNERQIIVKQRLLESFRRLLFKLEIQLSKYDTILAAEYDDWQLKVREAEMSGTKIPSFEINDKLEMNKLKILQTIIETRDAMGTLEFTPTVAEKDPEIILKRLQERADRLSQG